MLTRSGELRHITMPNFLETGLSIAEILRFFDFSRWGRPPSWIYLGHIWTTNSEYLGVSITQQNLVMIDAVVFIIWTFQYVACLAGKCLFMPPKLCFFGQFDPLNGLQYQPKPKRHTLAWVRVIWAIKRENVVSGLTVDELLTKGGINKKHNITNISPICPEAPHGQIFTKFCTAVEVVDLITCDNFFSDQLRYVDSVGVKNEGSQGFPLTKPVAVNTGLCNCAACD